MLSSLSWLLLSSFVGQLLAGTFIGDVKVEYNVFTVLESESFEIKCTATHEDKRPQLRWYFIGLSFNRKNLTSFATKGGTGNTARDTFRRSKARFSDLGDYFCEAMVIKQENSVEEKEKKSSGGVPIFVLSKERKPRVTIRKSVTRQGDTQLTCSVVPVGVGKLTWYRDGSYVASKVLAVKHTVLAKTSGKYSCVGNLTVGGYKHFLSTAYASRAVGLTSQFLSLSTTLVCVFYIVVLY